MYDKIDPKIYPRNLLNLVYFDAGSLLFKQGKMAEGLVEMEKMISRSPRADTITVDQYDSLT